MAEIKCPNCGEIIKLDKSDYDLLLNEVRNEEFEKSIKNREKEIEDRLKAHFALEAVNAKNKLEKENDFLKNQISVLSEKLDAGNKNTEVEVIKATEVLKDTLSKKDREIIELKNTLESSKKDSKLLEQSLKNDYEVQLKLKDQEIERYKNFRLGDSTKDLGESLEVYCHESFEEVRAVAYPYAYFEKDNEVIKGGKGDFIFKDYSPDGIELVSIMFEMKNQKDDTEKKHKNEDFFKKLDTDRKNKGLEYAVLVTTLEEDSKLYNNGIVDVSHKYEKMFVVRPQFFLAIIGLIRNMALKSYEYKKQVAIYQEEHIDITKFEDNVKLLADKISNDYLLASNKYDEVEKMCDDIIKKVNAFKETFRIARNHIGTANNRLEDLSIRKLTKDNPTMKARFDELKKND